MADSEEDKREAARKARRWAARKAALNAASAADARAAQQARDATSRRREDGYHHQGKLWIGFGVALVLALLGYLLVERLIGESRLEDCLLAHRSNCATPVEVP